MSGNSSHAASLGFPGLATGASPNTDSHERCSLRCEDSLLGVQIDPVYPKSTKRKKTEIADLLEEPG